MKNIKAQHLAVLSINLLLFITWGIPGIKKLMSGKVPDFFYERFGETILGTFPGIPISFWSIALFETALFVVALISVLKLEFLKGSYCLLKWALAGSMLCFVQLGFGMRLIGNNDGAASLFFYFAGITSALIYINWLEKNQA